MGYAIVMGFCIACRKQISFNPHKVPSLLVVGIREPLCKECAEKWNKLHPENARPILDGAYEHFDENEL